MSWTIKTTKRFDHHMDTLVSRLGLSHEEAKAAFEEFTSARELLAKKGTLPAQYGYQLHKLKREPWRGFMEFHIADNVLVVYADVTKQKIIRLTGIYNHELLKSGKLD